MADDSQTIADQVQQQNIDNYQEEVLEGGAEPVDIDEAHKQAFGEEHHTDQSINIAKEIDEDEQNVQLGSAPIGSDVAEEN